jgi:multidrug efflux pump subunit AcrA (membrane-fusion protein)
MPSNVHRFLCLLMLTAAQLQPVYSQQKKEIRVRDVDIVILDQRQLSSEIPGLLVYLNPMTEGQIVKKGDLLIRLNDAVIEKQFALAVAKANSEVEIKFAEVALEKSRIDLEVYEEQQTKARQRTTKVTELPFTESEMRQARLEVDKAEAQLKKVTEDKVILEMEAATKAAEREQYRVIAPTDGVITKVHVRPGQSVRQGDPILTLTDLSVLRARVEVDYAYAEDISIGDDVEIMVTQSVRQQSEGAPKAFSRDAENENDPFNGAPGASAPGGRKGAASPDRNEKPAQEPEPSRVGEKFLGRVTFISPQLNPTTKHLEVYVDVPNRQDAAGRYILKEHVQVDAVILPKSP